MGSLLLVGTASDGPLHLTRWVDDATNILKIFGNTFTQRSILTPTQTSLTLAFNTNFKPIDFLNNKTNQLYLINQTTANTISFGKIGGVSNVAYDFKFEPYLGNTDLCWMIERYQTYQPGGYVVRIGGTKATATVGGWVFSGRYTGSKYNRITIVTNGTTVTVSGLEPNYTSKTYTGTAQSIIDEIKYDLSLGISCVDIDTWNNTIPTGTVTLSGGLDGSLTPSIVYDALLTTDIPLDVSHVYVPIPLSQELVTKLSLVEIELGRPIIWIVPSPAVTYPVSTWCTGMITSVPERLDSMIVVPGTCEVSKNGRTVSRYAAEEVAMSLGTSTFNLTNTKIPVRDFEPKFTEAELTALTGYGYTCITRQMYNDVSIYQGVTSSRYTSFFKQFITSICVSRITAYMDQFIGTVQEDGPNSDMERGVQASLDNINFFDIDNIEVVVNGSSIYVTVNGTIPNEILTISFIVST